MNELTKTEHEEIRRLRRRIGKADRRIERGQNNEVAVKARLSNRLAELERKSDPYA